MPYLEWSDEYSVGVDVFDQHHKKLVSLVNALHDAMSQGRGKDVIGPLLNRLVTYTDKHFAIEEAKMEEIGYADLAAHKEEHKKLREKVFAFQQDYNAGRASISLEVMAFLRDWLTGHIQGTDKKYTAPMNEAGVS